MDHRGPARHPYEPVTVLEVHPLRLHDVHRLVDQPPKGHRVGERGPRVYVEYLALADQIRERQELGKA